MAFVSRKIELTFILGQGAFGTDGEITVKVPDVDAGKPANTASIPAGLRVKARVQLIGNETLGNATLQVFGLSDSIINQLASISQYAVFTRRNRVIISAGDDQDGMGVVFEGQINQAWVDFSAMPDAVLHLSAAAGYFYLVKPAEPTSFQGSADVSTIVASIAAQMGYSVENNGVSVTLATPYYPGTLIDQLRAACAHANIDYVINDEDRLIAIMPRGKGRGGVIPVVSRDTGMIGYPVHSPTGVIVSTLFNRNIRLRGMVKIESSLKPANGEWLVIAVHHDLESMTPGGQWATHFEAVNPGNPHAQPSLQ